MRQRLWIRKSNLPACILCVHGPFIQPNPVLLQWGLSLWRTGNENRCDAV
jgi:hypothetical protein